MSNKCLETKDDSSLECTSLYDCCDCGYGNCGCRYCFSCNACEVCLGEEDE